MASSSTISINNTIEWAKRFCFDRPSAIGNMLEPAITNANTILQTILGAPFAWRWNRVVTGFITTPGQQDYTLFNWTPSTVVSTGWVTVDTAGNCQKATNMGVTGTTVAWNTNVGGTTIDGQVLWTNLGLINSAVSQSYKFDWIETVSIQASDPNVANAPRWIEISPKICLGLDSARSRPGNIAAQGDDGQGNITFRLMPVPDQAYPIAITLQQKPPVLTSLNQTWAPVPDEYSRIYNWGLLALLLLFSDDPRFQVTNQKFITCLLAANQGLSQTEVNIWLNNWQALTGQPMAKQATLSQGQQARGV